jgi:hypothetical protein
MLATANLKFNSIQFIKNLEWQSTQTQTENSSYISIRIWLCYNN